MAGDPLWTIDATLRAKGFVLERPPMVYRGPIKVHGVEALAEIEVPDLRFVRMPIVRLLDTSSLLVKRMAHVLAEGSVCYFGQGGLPLDLYNPGGSVLRVIAEAETALGRSYAGGAKAEFEAELQHYWEGNWYYVAISRDHAPAVVEAEYGPIRPTGDPGLLVVAKGLWPFDKKAKRNPAIVLTFADDLKHAGGFPPETLADSLRYIATQATPPRGWRQAVLRAAAEDMVLFLSAPNAIVGWKIVTPPAVQSLIDAGRKVRTDFVRAQVEKNVEIVALERKAGLETDLRKVVERNLFERPNLIGKDVVLIGCGTIGGYLARMLAQSGAGCEGTLSLYDRDLLSPGNIGRHALGFSDLGRRKVDALADHTRGFHPQVDVRPFAQDAVSSWPAICDADLVIDATGDPNVASALNDLLMSESKATKTPALLHTWVFGNGVAAQSFLNLKDGFGCYRCLKTAFDGEWRHNPLKDVTSPLQQAPARCGEGGYIPFAVDASLAAAALTLRAALDWSGGKPGQRLRTTIVDHESGRKSLDWVSPKKLETCPACS